MLVCSICNEKGGVGKSAAVFQIAGLLAKAEKRVLVVDADPQENTSNVLLINSDVLDDEDHYGLGDVLLGLCSIKDAIVNAPLQVNAKSAPRDVGIDIVPPNSRKEVKLFKKNLFAMRDALQEVADDYDFCLIDYPPERPFISTNGKEFNLVMMGLCATDRLLAPCTPDEDSFTGFSHLAEHVAVIRRMYNPLIKNMGCFLNNMTDAENDMVFLEQCEEKLAPTGLYSGCCVRSSPIVKTSRTKYRPLAWYYSTSPAANDYRRLTKYLTGVDVSNI